MTILMGAGAMYDCTKISTSSLTTLVTEKEQTYFDNTLNQIVKSPILKEIESELKCYYSTRQRLHNLENDPSESVSFEDVLHTLEMIDSYNSSKSRDVIKKYKSIFPMFTTLKEDYKRYKDACMSAKSDLIFTVINEIGKQENSSSLHIWFCDFFKEIGKYNNLDIFTLNYDTWMNQIYINNYVDGFIPLNEDYYEFEPKILFDRNNNLHTINHLHGHICLTSSIPSFRAKYIWQENSLYKARTYDLLKKDKYEEYPLYSSMGATQSGETIDNFPIITGLRKTDKLLKSPFDAYYHHLYQSIIDNDKLLIIGYGFGDLYINSLLNQFRNIYPNGRAVIIDYLDNNKWIHNIFETRAIPQNAKDFYYRLFRDTDLAYKIIGFTKPSYIDAKDNTKSIYFDGFKNVVENCKNRETRAGCTRVESQAAADGEPPRRNRESQWRKWVVKRAESLPI